MSIPVCIIYRFHYFDLSKNRHGTNHYSINLMKVKRNEKGVYQLTLQTFSLIVGFMAWSIISPLMPFITQDIKISASQISIILAIPVILGSVLRVPFGYLTNIIGAKWVFFSSFIVLLFPIFFLGQAQSTTMLIICGSF